MGRGNRLQIFGTVCRFSMTTRSAGRIRLAHAPLAVQSLGTRTSASTGGHPGGTDSLAAAPQEPATRATLPPTACDRRVHRDFYCPSAALIIELDGAHHQDQLATDSQRDAILSGMGLRVLRFPNSQVCADLPGVLRRIESAIERGVPPSHLMGRGTGG